MEVLGPTHIIITGLVKTLDSQIKTQKCWTEIEIDIVACRRVWLDYFHIDSLTGAW